MAAKLRKDLGIEVEMVHGRYAEYKVLVDDETVIDGGTLTALGVVPADKKVIDVVRARLSGGTTAG